jgi:hypothetical protein
VTEGESDLCPGDARRATHEPAQVLGQGDYSSSNLTILRTEAVALQNWQQFQRSQLTELARDDFESWAKESFEISTKIAYRRGGLIGSPRGVNKDCTMVAEASVISVGYVG